MKKCTGCDRLETAYSLGLNNKGILYLSCCPDNNYVEMTAVEWFVEQIRNNKFIGASEQIEVIYQAKEMEKQQIIEARQSGIYATINGKSISNIDYYKETYKK